MRLNNFGSSLVEVMIVMLIFVLGIVGAYGAFSGGQKLAQSVGHKTKAIQIAREGIETMTNIRDTNWLVFEIDMPNCWNTLNYNIACIGDNTTDSDIKSGSYTIYPNSTTGRWTLSSESLPSSDTNSDGVIGLGDTGYLDDFKVQKDASGFYTQDGTGTDTSPKFTREIRVSYYSDEALTSLGDSNDKYMKIESIVYWSEAGNLKKVTLETVLTNWKYGL